MASATSFELTEDDKLRCARTIMRQLSKGDETSKALVSERLTGVDASKAQFKCPVSVCTVLYELDAEDGSEKRNGDCAVVMAGIRKVVGGRSR